MLQQPSYQDTSASGQATATLEGNQPITAEEEVATPMESAYPEGKIEDVLVKFDKFIFLVDFIVLDFEADKKVLIILGRPFLSTGKTLIDVQKRELTMRMNDQQVTFNVLEAMKSLDEAEDCNFLSIMDLVVVDRINRCCSKEVIKATTFESFEEEDVAANQIDWMGERQSNRHSKFNEPLNLSDREVKTILPSIESPPTLELKLLPSHLKYAYLGQNNTLPVIISSTLDADQEKSLVIRRCALEEEIPYILQSCHTAAYGGHFGAAYGGHFSGHRTAAKVLQSCYCWPSVFKDAYEFSKCCDSCQRTGNITQRHEMPLTNILEVEIFYVWGINFIGLFPPSFGTLYILVAVDYVFKWVKVVALPINDARAVVNFLQRSIFSKFDNPRAIISDEGTHLCNKVFAAAMVQYGVKHKITTVYHPQSNGQAEVSNKEIKKILEKVVNLSRKDWSLRLHDSLWAYRITYKTRLGMSPYRIVYGKACHLPLKLEHKTYWALKQLNWDIHDAAE
ncbi:Ribonuclease H [Citrus sinensis]|nr:Ribonuclease H [Citrus sinensis]